MYLQDEERMFGMNVHTVVIKAKEKEKAERVLYKEHEFLVDVISNIVDGKIQLGEGNY